MVLTLSRDHVVAMTGFPDTSVSPVSACRAPFPGEP
jgi:hypothetical protein